MMRAAALVLFTAALAVAAPAPKPAAKKIEDVFGAVVEAKGVTCEMTQRGELRVGVSKEAATDGDAHAVARPLVTRKVKGDFAVTVRVAHAPPDGNVASALGGGDPTVSAGIALYPPDKPEASITFLQRHINERAGWKTDYCARTQYNETAFESNTRPGKTLEGGPVYLRITRRGNEFTSAWSHDGKRWTPAALQGRFGFPSEVLIGPVAAHNTTAGYSVTFDEYALTKPPEEKK